MSGKKKSKMRRKKNLIASKQKHFQLYLCHSFNFSIVLLCSRSKNFYFLIIQQPRNKPNHSKGMRILNLEHVDLLTKEQIAVVWKAGRLNTWLIEKRIFFHSTFISANYFSSVFFVFFQKETKNQRN